MDSLVEHADAELRKAVSVCIISLRALISSICTDDARTGDISIQQSFIKEMKINYSSNPLVHRG